jgi:hypothetical protein
MSLAASLPENSAVSNDEQPRSEHLSPGPPLLNRSNILVKRYLYDREQVYRSLDDLREKVILSD